MEYKTMFTPTIGQITYMRRTDDKYTWLDELDRKKLTYMSELVLEIQNYESGEMFTTNRTSFAIGRELKELMDELERKVNMCMCKGHRENPKKNMDKRPLTRSQTKKPVDTNDDKFKEQRETEQEKMDKLKTRLRKLVVIVNSIKQWDLDNLHYMIKLYNFASILSVHHHDKCHKIRNKFLNCLNNIEPTLTYAQGEHFIDCSSCIAKYKDHHGSLKDLIDTCMYCADPISCSLAKHGYNEDEISKFKEMYYKMRDFAV